MKTNPLPILAAASLLLPGGPCAAETLRVKTTNPSTGEGLAVSSEQPADVRAYYSTAIHSPAAGTIKTVEKDIGDRVAAGETIIVLTTAADPKTDIAIAAPFNGTLSGRPLDPGSFVANPATVPGVPPLATIQRDDIVTISGRVPESFARFLGPSTPLEIRLDALPGSTFRGTPARIAPSLDTDDRTRTVELDLFNGTRAEYKALLESSGLDSHSALKARAVPVFPGPDGSDAAAGLIPGMYGKMKASFRIFAGEPLVPSSAIVRKGGVPHLFTIENGIARLKQVEVGFDDGSNAKASWRSASGNTPLSAQDVLILPGQPGLEDGVAVEPAPAN